MTESLDTVQDLALEVLAMTDSTQLSIFSGPPLDDEPGVFSLTLPGYFTEVTHRYPERDAVVFHERDGSVTRWTYQELYAHALGVARALVASGYTKGDLVAVLMTNRPEWLSSVFGILLAGGTVVPLSTFSTAPELAYLLKASCASTLIFERHVLQKDFAAILEEIEPAIAHGKPGSLFSEQFPFLQRLISVDECPPNGVVEAWDDFLRAGEPVTASIVAARSAAIAPCDPGMLYFSSGSTGFPKGIVNSQRGVAIQMWRWGQFLGLPHDGSVRGWGGNGFFWSGAFVQAAGAVFSSGGTLILQPTFDPEQALELFEREKVNYLTCWPHQYARLVDAANYAQADLSSLKYITRGTAIESHPSVRTDWIEPVCSYGSTETFTINCAFPHDVPQSEWCGSHGRVLPGNTVKIVDPISGEVLPIGQSGEIVVKGPTLMLGYVGVTNDAILDHEGFFPTGDGGHFDESGRLFFEGRLTDIIKTGGANVSPKEIDAVLASLEGVKTCQTVGVPDANLGELIVSCVVPAQGSALDQTRLRDQLKARLASYKVPRKILFLQEHELSFTGSAKVRTAALRELVGGKLKSPSAP